eukprot:TRINITY_DN10657_c0_g1_i6.p1 TRINITY_DN10657_c0_g1~~TRINITY_DN10657_c0_g1_i6.p1  ORF type:complete len:538 (+),score=69.75 TRINITY_DN10657_c0_g1_i6:176-1615(+)
MGKCPKSMNEEGLECQANSKMSSCSKSGSFMIYPTSTLGGRMCFPKDPGIIQYLNQTLSLQQWEGHVQDVVSTWKLIIICGITSFLFGFAYLCIIRNCAGPMVWAALIGFLLLMIFLSYLSYEKLQKVEAANDPNMEFDVTLWKVVTYGSFGAIAIYGLLLCCCLGKIQLSIAVIQSGAYFVFDVVSSLLVPPITILLVTAVVLVFGAFASFVYSLGTPVPPSNPLYPIGTMKLEEEQKYYLYTVIFGCFWNIALVYALSEFVLASCTCIWYFREGGWYLLKSFFRGIFYHLGSLAFGSLLIALLWTVRVIFEVIADQANRLSETNPITRGILCCVRCCLDCFERFLKLLNRNAYIQIAITGKGFLGASKDAIDLMLRNGVSFGLTFGLSGIFTFLGRICITGATMALGYYVLTRDIAYYNKIGSPLFPCICIGVIAFLIASVIMNVYSVACEAILQCFLIDTETVSYTHLTLPTIYSV